MKSYRCATCGKSFPVEGPDASVHFPFCGQRCRMADLDRWFTEEFAIPGSPEGLTLENEEGGTG